MRNPIALCTIIFIVLSMPLFSATLTEGFNTTGWGGSYGDYTVNSWTLTNVIREATNIYEGAAAVRFNTSGSVKAIKSPEKSGGLGTLTFWYRRWSASDGSVLLSVFKSTDGTTWGSSIGSVTASSDTYSQYSYDINDASAKYIKVEALSTTKRCLLDYFSITDYTGPSINVSGLLNPFSTISGTASDSQSYSVSGTNLQGNVTVDAPEGFEISRNGTTFQDTRVLIQYSGTLKSKTVYSRIA